MGHPVSVLNSLLVH